MVFETKLEKCGGTIKVDFPAKPSEITTQCTCEKQVQISFRWGVWGGLYVSSVEHVVKED